MWNSFRRFFIWSSVFAAIMVAAMAAVSDVRAATVTGVTFEPTSLETGAAISTSLIFTTSSGIQEGETITLTFDAAFTTSSIQEDDVDILDDGVQLTTAADCSGSEQVAAAVVGPTLMLQACAGDGGAVASGSVVRMLIGTNATSSGIGSQTITNPSQPGTYFVTIGGTFGDSGSIPVVIAQDARETTVSATVPSSSNGSSSPVSVSSVGEEVDTRNLDTSGPSICCLVISQISDYSATISWNTDEAANAFVDYGLTAGYEEGTMFNATAYETPHTLVLSGLSAGMTYHFRIRSRDVSGNQTSAGDYTFETPDMTAPIISNIQILDIGETSARIVWQTDEPASSVISYGTTSQYGLSVQDTTKRTDHSMSLSGLTKNTVYHFRISATDALQNTSTSSDESFQTIVNLPPANVTDLTATSGDRILTLMWHNPSDPDLAGILIRCSPTGYPTTPQEGNTVFEGLSEGTTISGLQNDVPIYCTVYAYNTRQQFSSGAIIQGIPVSVVLPPVILPTEPTPETIPPTQPIGTTIPPSIEPTETVSTMSPILPVLALCGNGMCEQGEEGACTLDCPVTIPVPNPLPSASGLWSERDIRFLVAQDKIDLALDEQGRLSVLAETPLDILLTPSSSEVRSLHHVQIALGTDAYLMNKEGEGRQQTVITTPATIGSYELTLTLFFEEGGVQIIKIPITGKGVGIVSEKQGSDSVPVSGMVATVYQGAVFWEASSYGEVNPIITDASGQIAWYLPNGTYTIRLSSQAGAERKTMTVTVTDHILNPSIQLEAVPLLEQIGNTVTSGATSSLTQVVGNIPPLAAAVEKTQETLGQIRSIPAVQQTSTIAQPILVTSAIAGTAVLATSFNLIPLFQSFITSPIVFFRRKKRKGYGMVYNAITKLPIDLAIVRLYRASDNRLVQSRVTDLSGRFFFLVQPGTYRIDIRKPNFVFPTSYLERQKEDLQLVDLYHGETIEVTDKDAVITPNVPVDPHDMEHVQTPVSVKRLKRLRSVQRIGSRLGTVMSLLVFFVQPSFFSAAIVVGQILVYLLVQRLARVPKPKSWGIVYDEKTGRPLENAVVRLFEPKYKKLLETAVTDAHGRYTFLVGSNVYLSTYQKNGYGSLEIHPIDYTNRKEPGEIAIDVKLSPESSPIPTIP